MLHTHEKTSHDLIKSAVQLLDKSQDGGTIFVFIFKRHLLNNYFFLSFLKIITFFFVFGKAWEGVGEKGLNKPISRLPPIVTS